MCDIFYRNINALIFVLCISSKTMLLSVRVKSCGRRTIKKWTIVSAGGASTFQDILNQVCQENCVIKQIHVGKSAEGTFNILENVALSVPDVTNDFGDHLDFHVEEAEGKAIFTVNNVDPFRQQPSSNF